MDENQNKDELSKWFSTYGLITADRILGTYGISIPESEILVAIKSPYSFYHHLIKVPLKNIFNGIVMQQAHDYHVYVQKLFIDYLLSGETGKGEDAQGATTREALENERKQLLTLGEEFHDLQLKHDALIGSSQLAFRKLVKTWKSTIEDLLKVSQKTFKEYSLSVKKSEFRRAVEHALIYCDLTHSEEQNNKYLLFDACNEMLKIESIEELKESLAGHFTALIKLMVDFYEKVTLFNERATEIGEQALSFRSQFYATILRVNELIALLPEYKIDPVQDAINREPLYFDKSIGEKEG